MDLLEERFFSCKFAFIAKGGNNEKRSITCPESLPVIDRAWFVCLYGEISSGIIDRTGAQIMLYLTCTTITSINLAHYGVSRAKDWVSVNCCTSER